MKEQKDYKKEYFRLVRYLNWLEFELKNRRCPPLLYRKCCGGCNLLKAKLKDKKQEMLGDEFAE